MPRVHCPSRVLCVMLSGSGRTLVNLQSRISQGQLEARVGLVIASRPCPGVERARELGLPVIVRRGSIPATELAAELEAAGAGLVVLAGYLSLVNIPPGWEHRVVNIHPALLPAFGGPKMYGERVHQAVLDAGCKVSGCTVHLCDGSYDTGPILVQRCCPVLEGDTPASLAARVFEEECRAYPHAVELLLAGRVEVDGPTARILGS